MAFSIFPFYSFFVFPFFRFSIFPFFRILRFIFRLFGTILIWGFFCTPTAACDTSTYRGAWHLKNARTLAPGAGWNLLKVTNLILVSDLSGHGQSENGRAECLLHIFCYLGNPTVIIYHNRVIHISRSMSCKSSQLIFPFLYIILHCPRKIKFQSLILRVPQDP